MKPEFSIKNTSLPALGAFIFFLFVTVFAAGYLFSRNELKKTMIEAEDKIDAVGHLKQTQLSQWLKERRGDCRVIKENTENSLRFFDYSRNPDTAKAGELKAWMESRIQGYGYENIFFFDDRLKLKLRTGENQEKGFNEQFYSMLRKADSTGEILFSGLYKSSDSGTHDIDFMIPLSIQGKKNLRAGFIILRSDPESFIYPVLNKNLFYKTSAENILMQNIPGIMEVFNPAKGIYGKVESVPSYISDGKGIEVPDTVFEVQAPQDKNMVMAVNRIPGSSWYLVSRVNRAEIDEPVEKQRTMILLITGLIAVGASVGAGLIWRSRQATIYKRLNTELENKITERTTELVAANKELEAFAYSVSHDLRAPLRSISGFSKALAEDYKSSLDATGNDYLTRLREASDRMDKLINDILSLSRITRKGLVLKEVNLSELAGSISEELKKTTPERKVEFIIQDAVLAKGDLVLLQSVLNNLLENAYKFTSKTENARIEFGSTQKYGKPICFVKDNGAGFDMKYADKLFSPFQRLHHEDEFPGTGIGLSKCKEGGAKTRRTGMGRSRERRGCRFLFYFK